MTKARYDVPIEPKAGGVGTISVVFFGVLYIVIAFDALYQFFDADFPLAAATAVGAIVVPMTVGFSVSELVHQRAGAFWFVLTAAILTGALGAWALAENEDFENHMDLIAPEATIPGYEPPEAETP